jgi:hypothetical protein
MIRYIISLSNKVTNDPVQLEINYFMQSLLKSNGAITGKIRQSAALMRHIADLVIRRSIRPITGTTSQPVRKVLSKMAHWDIVKESTIR